MSKVFAVLFLGLLGSVVMLNRVDASLVSADQIRCPEGDCKKDKDHQEDEDTFAHCGECEGDEENEEGDEDSLAHCGECEGDEENEEGNEDSLAHCGECEGDEDEHDDGEGDESLV